MARQSFWQNKKVLVTGASGFIGSHLIKQLLAKKAHVYTLSYTKINSGLILSSEETANIKKEIVGDIFDKKIVFKTFKEIHPTVCFHLAAQPLVELGEAEPSSTFETNIMGTVYVLEASRIYKTKSIILASTSHVYGVNKTPLLEEYFPQPSRPYETSKACADIIAQTYASYFKLPVYIARFTNIYGPGDMNQRLVPRTITLLSQKQSPVVYNKNIIRDFLYIDDAINAYLTLAQKGHKLKFRPDNIIFNFGSGQSYHTGEIVDQIKVLMNKENIVSIQKQNLRSDEILDQTLSIKKVAKILKWTAQHNLRTGLAKTIKFYLGTSQT